MKMTRKLRQWAIVLAICVPTTYAAIAVSVFRFRHPWMTETELLIAMPHALMFGTCTYSEWRTR